MPKQRWYDEHKNLIEVLSILERLPESLVEELAVNIIGFANLLRKNNEENNVELPLSIGKSKVLGLYQSFKRRRWYDKNLTLMAAMNIMATLPKEDFEKIAEGALLTLKDLRRV